MNLDRRTFLSTLGSAALFGAVGHAFETTGGTAPFESQANSPLPIIDTHQHLWDLSVVRLPWLKNVAVLNRSFLPDDYRRASQGLAIEKAIYMEVGAAEADLAKEAAWILRLCRESHGATAAAVVGGRPGKPGFADYLRPLRNSRFVKGIRHIPAGGDEGVALWRSRAFRDDIRRLGEWGLSFDIAVPPVMLPAAVALVKRCPATQFILDHCGNADPKMFPPYLKEDSPRARKYRQNWREGVAALAELPNVVCKISGLLARMPKNEWRTEHLAPIIEFCLNAFGPDRVMFAGNWPVCTRGGSLRQWVEVVRTVTAARPLEERRKLFSENARRVYRLD
ncbi:amidohydrolase [Thermostilla marina]